MSQKMGLLVNYIYMKTLENHSNLAELESRLNKYPFLSKNTLPGSPDARIFIILQATKRFPDRRSNPNFYHWYILMRQFSNSTISKWISDELYYDPEDCVISEFVKLYSCRKEGAESNELPSQARGNKFENSAEVQYAIDITLKEHQPDKTTSLRKLLDEYKAEMTQDDIANPKHIRIVCRIDPAHLDAFSRKISNSIEFNQLSLRKKDMKPKPTPQPDKPNQ